MTHMSRAQLMLSRTALAACLSAGLIGGFGGLSGCTSNPGPGGGERQIDRRGPDGPPPRMPTIGRSAARTRPSPPTPTSPPASWPKARRLWDRALTQYNKALGLATTTCPALFRLGVLYCKFHHYPACDRGLEALPEGHRRRRHRVRQPRLLPRVGRPVRRGPERLRGRHPPRPSQRTLPGELRPDAGPPGKVQPGDARVAGRPARAGSPLQPRQRATSSTGRREQARVEYRKALDLDPQMADARARLDALNGIPAGGTPVASAPATPAAPTIPTTPTTPVAPPATQPASGESTGSGDRGTGGGERPGQGPTTAPTTSPAATVDAGAPVTPEAHNAGDGRRAGTPKAAPVELAGPTTQPTTQPTTPTVSTNGPTTKPAAETPAGDRGTADVSETPVHQD